MKAKEYFKKYSSPVQYAILEKSDEELKNLAGKLLQEFISDMNDIMKARNIKCDSGTVSVIKELNQKWNALCGLFEKNETPWIKRNGFVEFMKMEIPYLNLSMI